MGDDKYCATCGKKFGWTSGKVRIGDNYYCQSCSKNVPKYCAVCGKEAKGFGASELGGVWVCSIGCSNKRKELIRSGQDLTTAKVALEEQREQIELRRQQMERSIAKLDGVSKLFGRKEIKELPKILWDGEELERIAQGAYEQGQGVLVATNMRLLFIDKGMIAGLKVEDFPYDKINSIQGATGIIMGSIDIFSSGNKARISNVYNNQIWDFVNHVRAKIGKPQEAKATATTESIPDQIKKLAELRDAGILTPDEFEAKKADLLERL